ncbi:MAG: hypothetical protein GY769_04465 [bacterium]|nr:hypothetical protein [bacterium]
MAGLASYLDQGAVLKAEGALAAVTITGGDAKDAVEQNGYAIDRFAIAPHSSSDSSRKGLAALLAIGCVATLGHNETCVLIANVRHADNAGMSTNVSDFDHRASAQPPDITLPSLTISEQETTTYGVLEQRYDLTGARRYIQCQYTCTLSDASHADTAIISGLWVFHGAQAGPFEGGLKGSWAAMQ